MMTLLKRDKINYKILITDDDDDCRYGLNDIFERECYSIFLASCCIEADEMSKHE